PHSLRRRREGLQTNTNDRSPARVSLVSLRPRNVPAESEGFGSWEKVAALGWGIEKALGDQLAIGALYDRDYFCDAQIDYVETELNKMLPFSHIHQRKEIENYLLLPKCLARALWSALVDRGKRDGTSLPTAVISIEEELLSILKVTGMR